MADEKPAHTDELRVAAVPQKESGKQQGDPLDHDPEPTLKPSSDPLPAPDDNRHPHSPVAP